MIIKRYRSLGRAGRYVATLGLVGGLTAAAAACGSPPGSAPVAVSKASLGSAASLLPAAQKEGSVTLYSSLEPEQTNQVVTAMKQFGISVTVENLNTSTLEEKFSAESQSGTAAADVILLSDTNAANGFAGDGWLAKAGSVPGLAGWPSKYKTPYYAIVSINPLGYCLNTSSDSASPTSWNYLLNAKMRGQVITLNFKSAGPNPSFYLLYKEFGAGFMKRLAGQNPQLADSGPTAVQYLAAGSGSVFFPCGVTNAKDEQSQGAPVKLVLPSSGEVTGFETVAAVAARAPHPAAARFLTSFLLTPAGQKILNNAASSPVNAPGTPRLPANFVQPDNTDAAKMQSQIATLAGM